jgi:outer membrane murein-binding lipoprotein Lpp
MLKSKSVIIGAAVLALCGCTDSPARTAELEVKVAELEAAIDEVKRRADDAHDLADEANKKASEACQPFSLRLGCPSE